MFLRLSRGTWFGRKRELGKRGGKAELARLPLYHYFCKIPIKNTIGMKVRIEESWRYYLQEEFDKPYFEQLVDFVKSEYKQAQVLPPGPQLFHIFDACPFQQVKVVILGQDPYPTPGQYYGVCFSVPEGVAVPGSLANIFREIHDDLGKPIPASGNLGRWVAQGVFPLNSVLTVRAYQTGSHRGRGWETFTDAVIRKLSEEREHLVFMLWGRYAKEKQALIDTSKHLVLTAAHPSPRSAEYGFFGCKHFSRANTFLKEKGLTEIDW